MLQKFIQTLPESRASRRQFIIGATAAAGGFAIGFRSPARAAEPQVMPAAKGAQPFGSYVEIGADNIVTVVSAHMDMGQGIYNGVATLVAEELGADWSQMRARGGSGDPKLYGNLTWGGATTGTGGSSGTTSSWERYRLAGATAKAMLVAAAAAEWKVPASEIKVEKGVLSSGTQRASFGALAAKAAAMPVPADVKLKDAKDFVFIGNETLRRMDGREKTNGTEQFTIDVKLPGLLTAVMIHPPQFGATVKSFDAAKAKAIKGVVDVVQVPRGVAVVGDNMWAALKGRDAVTVVWDDSKAEKRNSKDLMATYRKTAAGTGAPAETRGNAEAGFSSAVKTLEATYEFPYLAHAALEPLNAVARRNADGTIEIWGGHQMPDIYQAISAQIAGVAPDKIRMHVMKTGGGFGRRAVADGDIVTEAVTVAMAINWRAPVKVQWTRENDTRGDRYRPAYVHRLKGGLDKDGNVVAWHNHIVGQSILKGTPFEGGLVKNGIDLTSVEGAAGLPYAFTNAKVELTTTDVGVPVLWWRAVGSTHTAYAVEAFLDELAEAAGKDPVQFRLAMLKDSPQHAAVLRLCAEKAGWGTPLPQGRFRGVALAESFHTTVAQIAEISVGRGNQIKVEKVTCAVDCGIAVNPDQVRAQMEGGIGFGLGAVMKSQLTLEDGKVVEGNFDGYQVLTIDEMPLVDVHIVQSGKTPTGVGEPGVPPIGPAVANAIYAATKKRIRILPFSRPENA
jgi:isoquinoline 1-oxidoreductase subunit beta